MLNFAEQTGSGAVMLVWSFLLLLDVLIILYITLLHLDRFIGPDLAFQPLFSGDAQQIPPENRKRPDYS